jgi:hypothetical protein
VNIGYEENQASVAVRPCFERSRAQSFSKLRRQHANANFFNDVPDPFDVAFPAHGDTSYIATSSHALDAADFLPVTAVDGGAFYLVAADKSFSICHRGL